MFYMNNFNPKKCSNFLKLKEMFLSFFLVGWICHFTYQNEPLYRNCTDRAIENVLIDKIQILYLNILSKNYFHEIKQDYFISW